MADEAQAQLSIANPEEGFARRLFQSYYERCQPEQVAPPDISQREFGLGTWDKKIESRHMAFRDSQALKSYLVRNTPFYISYSAAYYEFPDGRPMPRKGWMGADLVFDLDADHLELECLGKTHPKKFPCEKCLAAVKEETLKLIEEFLVPDFGFSKDEISVNFSGNRGYHVHVRNRTVRELSGWARREIADYISGAGLNGKSLFYSRFKGKLEGPTPETPGWHGKIAKRFVQLLQAGKLAEIGVEPVIAKRLQKNMAKVIEGVGRGNWDTVRMTGPEKEHLVEKLIGSAAIQIEGMGKVGDEVDVGVTFDVSKLIRLPNSLHGETGLAAKKVASVDSLASFEPMNDAVVFSDAPVRVKIGEAPVFRMKNRTFGPYKNQEVELPEFAAAYLICKREAKLWK